MSIHKSSGLKLFVIGLMTILCFSSTDPGFEIGMPAAAANLSSLMPLPRSMVRDSGTFDLTRNFTIVHEGYFGGRLTCADDRLLATLASRTGWKFPVPASRVDDEGASHRSLRIKCDREGVLNPGEDESYRLTIEKAGVLLEAGTDLGVMHGMETFLQLLEKRNGTWKAGAVRIEDSPRFPWRGLLLDTARHFMPVEVIRRNLDAMAAVKLNVLHLHLSDDQAFRMESRVFPGLHLYGSRGEYYTVEEMRDLIAYADARGILVVPEFDVPAHTTSWFAGYPALAARGGTYRPADTYGTFDNVMNPAQESTYRFLDAFFGDMESVFPGRFMHIGGDENSGIHWKENPEIRSFMKTGGLRDISSLQSYFSSRIARGIIGNGGTPVLWETSKPESIPDGSIVEIWWDENLIEKTALAGSRIVRALGYYLDWCYPASYHYLTDPVPNGLAPGLNASILGGEACMWSELVTMSTVDGRLWPRLASIAERFWSSKDVRDVSDMYRRLCLFEPRLIELGIRVREPPENAFENFIGPDPRYAVYRDSISYFVDLLEPVRRYRRQAAGSYTVDSRFTEAADLARPDPAIAREFSGLVDRYLSDRKSGADAGRRIREYLDGWKTMYERMLEIPEAGSELKKLMPMVQSLSILSFLGWEALEYMHTGMTPDPGWIDLGESALRIALSDQENVVLSVGPAIGKLVYAAAGIAPPEEMFRY